MISEWWEKDLSSLTNDELWEHYAKGLRYMDWYYQYADDSYSFNRGVAQEHYLGNLYSIMKSINNDRATEMYNKTCPFS